jgi:hypothetical protein
VQEPLGIHILLEKSKSSLRHSTRAEHQGQGQGDAVLAKVQPAKTATAINVEEQVTRQSPKPHLRPRSPIHGQRALKFATDRPGGGAGPVRGRVSPTPSDSVRIADEFIEEIRSRLLRPTDHFLPPPRDL